MRQSKCVYNWFPLPSTGHCICCTQEVRTVGEQGVTGSDCDQFQEGQGEGVKGEGEGGEEGERE